MFCMCTPSCALCQNIQNIQNALRIIRNLEARQVRSSDLCNECFAVRTILESMATKSFTWLLATLFKQTIIPVCTGISELSVMPSSWTSWHWLDRLRHQQIGFCNSARRGSEWFRVVLIRLCGAIPEGWAADIAESAWRTPPSALRGQLLHRQWLLERDLGPSVPPPPSAPAPRPLHACTCLRAHAHGVMKRS